MRLDDLGSMPVKGFLDEAEGRRLFELACNAGTLGPCLEIGGYCGKSTAYLGLGCQQAGAVLFSIDHHRGSEEQQPGQEYFDPELYDEAEGCINTLRLFRDTMSRCDLEDTVVPMVSTSAVVARQWTTPLGLVFIDGGHSYGDAFTDYTTWMPHIVPGGILAIHDIFLDVNEGGQAPYHMYKLALASRLFDELPMTGTLGVLRRRSIGEVPADVLAIRDW